jgi:hypothetical protein
MVLRWVRRGRFARGRIALMRFRAILQVILTVTVLSNACLAPMCQAACGGAMRDAGCHAAADSGMAAMMPGRAGMKHCPMCVELPAMKAAGTPMSCSHDACELLPASEGYAGVAAARLSVSATSGVFLSALPAGLRLRWAETPPLHRSSSTSSHTILRV